MAEIINEGIVRQNGWDQSIHCLFRCLGPGECHFPPSMMHYHDYIEFLYGLSGNATVVIGDRFFPMGPGDLILITPGEAHDVVHEDGRTEYFVVKFLPQLLFANGQSMVGLRYLLPLWQKKMMFSPAIPAATLAGTGTEKVLENMIGEFRDGKVGWELMMEAGILQVFTWILRTQCPNLPDEQAELNPSLKELLETVLQAAQSRYADFTARDAAKWCNLSYSYFSRSFKQLFGFSFTSYMEHLRLGAGERLLLTTDKEISEIAMDCGFGTTSYFIECFRRHYGVSPGAFRSGISRRGGESDR